MFRRTICFFCWGILNDFQKVVFGFLENNTGFFSLLGGSHSYIHFQVIQMNGSYAYPHNGPHRYIQHLIGVLGTSRRLDPNYMVLVCLHGQAIRSRNNSTNFAGRLSQILGCLKIFLVQFQCLDSTSLYYLNVLLWSRIYVLHLSCMHQFSICFFMA